MSGTDQDYLACPARFERATYALEEIVAARISNNFNCLQHKMANVTGCIGRDNSYSNLIASGLATGLPAPAHASNPPAID